MNQEMNMTSRTSAYRYTVQIINGKVAEADLHILNTIKKAAKAIGKRVCLAPRLGRNNPNAWKYIDGRDENGNYCTKQMVRIADATRADVYVQDRPYSY